MNMERKFTTSNPFEPGTEKFSHIEKLSDSIANIQYWFNELNEALEKAEEENRRLKSEQYKEQELIAMSEKLKKAESERDKALADSRLGFPITKEESDAINSWIEEHDVSEHDNFNHYHGCSGGGYSYEFYPTTIGTVGTCVCDICRKRAYAAAYNNESHSFCNQDYIKYMSEHNGEFQFRSLL